MNLRYRVTLSPEECAQLRALVSGGTAPVRRIKRAQVLLAANAGVSDETISSTVGVGTATIFRTRRRFVEEGLEQALSEDPRPGAPRKLSGNEEAMLIATACTNAPEGRARWTLELLADEMVRLTGHQSISIATIGRRLDENELKPWQKKMWCIPKVDTEFVARMEDVLDLYAESGDPKRPVVPSTRPLGSSSARRASRIPSSQARRRGWTTNTCAMAPPTCSCFSTYIGLGDT